MFTTIFPILASEPGWFEKLMTAARLEMVELSAITSAVATELAAIFCIIYLISVAKDIMSDTQAGGFGSIELTNLLVPLIMFFIVLNFSTIMRPLNNLTDKVTSIIVSEAEGIAGNPNAFLEDLINEEAAIEDEANGDDTFAFDIFHDEKKDRSGSFIRSIVGIIAPGVNVVHGIVNFTMRCIEGLICGIINFIFDLEKYIMTVYTNIHLAFLCFLGPFVFAFSILPNWRNAYKSWLGSFIEVSFWKVGIAIIVMFVAIVRATVDKNTEPSLAVTMGLLKFTSATMFRAFWSAIVSWAGYKCLKRVPSLIHLALSLSSEAGGSDTGGAAVGGAIAETAKTGTKIAAGAAGIPGFK